MAAALCAAAWRQPGELRAPQPSSAEADWRLPPRQVLRGERPPRLLPRQRLRTAMVSRNDPEATAGHAWWGRISTRYCCYWLSSLDPADGWPILCCWRPRQIDAAQVLREAVLPCSWLLSCSWLLCRARSRRSRARVGSLRRGGGCVAVLHSSATSFPWQPFSTARWSATGPSRSFGPEDVLQAPPGLRWLRRPAAGRGGICGQAAQSVCTGSARVDGGERTVQPRAPLQGPQRGILNVPIQVCSALTSRHRDACENAA